MGTVQLNVNTDEIPSIFIEDTSWIISNISLSENGIFNYDQHTANNFKVLESYLDDQLFTDVTLIARDRRITAHRIVLAANSKYLSEIFSENPMEREIEMNGVNGESLETLVKYCYTGSIELQKDNWLTPFKTARLLQLNPVVEAYCQYLIKQLHPNNCLGIKIFADNEELAHLSSVAHAYALDNFVEVIKNTEFLHLTPEHMTMLLKSEDVNVPSEETIFHGFMTWLQHDFSNRFPHASFLFNYVKFPLLTPTFIHDQIKHYKLFMEQSALKDLILEAFLYHAVPEHRLILQSDRTRPRKSTIDQTFLFVGKLGGDGGRISIEVFSLRENTWKTLLNTESDQTFFATAILETQLFIVGGTLDGTDTNTVMRFDLSTFEWTDPLQMDTPRNVPGVAVLKKSLYAVGGQQGKIPLNTVEKWDSVTQQWSYVSPMSTKRTCAGVAVLKDKLYVVGGWDGANYLSTVEFYDPEENRWNFCASLSKPRSGLAVGVLNGCIYAVGGLSDNEYLDSVERYDPNAGTWTMVAPMSAARCFFGVGALANRLIAVGGRNETDSIKVVETYDPLLDQWQTVAPLEAGRQGYGVVVKNSVIKI